VAGREALTRAGEVTAVTATRLEAWAVRRRARGARLQRVGVAMRDRSWRITTPVAISVGLAGGLSRDVAPGTVVIASEIALGDGAPAGCDAWWLDAMTDAAQRLAVPVIRAPLVTLPVLAVGPAREPWAGRGFAAVDMESAMLIGRAPRIGAVRVVLDSPERELSASWLSPWRAALRPRCWVEFLWLANHAPVFALRAAAVFGLALRHHEIDAQI